MRVKKTHLVSLISIFSSYSWSNFKIRDSFGKLRTCRFQNCPWFIIWYCLGIVLLNTEIIKYSIPFLDYLTKKWFEETASNSAFDDLLSNIWALFVWFCVSDCLIFPIGDFWSKINLILFNFAFVPFGQKIFLLFFVIVHFHFDS